jgi:hypothetical protein
MPTKSTQSSSEGIINHYGAVRIRAVGSASLQLTLYSPSETKESVLRPLVLQSATDKEMNRLSNFTQQRAKLEIRTTEIGEIFNINKIIIFVKPTAKSYPE